MDSISHRTLVSLARELEATEETLSKLCLLSGLVTECGPWVSVQGCLCPIHASAVKWWIKLLFVRPAAHSSALGVWLSAELQMHPGFFQFNSHLLK